MTVRSILLRLACGLILLAPVLASESRVSSAQAPSHGFWHTAGTEIVDAVGRPVRIAGVTWYGMESTRWVPGGLDFQPYRVIMDEVKLLGYNTIRLPFSNELVERNPVVRGNVAANPEFRGHRALDVLDAIAQYARTIDLRIILDDHRSAAGRPRGVNTLKEPLWYTSSFPQAAWLRDWRTLAQRYAGNDAVVGFDLRNEPHVGPVSRWDLQAYLYHGATWGPYAGKDNAATDWRLAAERAGNAILGVNPHALIIVEGLQLYPDASQPGGVLSSWWSGILTPVKAYPVRLRVPHQLVYSAHEWGPLKWQMPWFKHMSYSSLLKVWEKAWAFLLDQPAATHAAPLLLGEFGTCATDRACIDRQAPDNQAMWFQSLLRFLREHPAAGWIFYALNGTNANNCATNNGLLNPQWNRLRSAPLQRALATIEPLPATAAPGSGQSALLLAGTATSRRPRDPHAALCLLP